MSEVPSLPPAPAPPRTAPGLPALERTFLLPGAAPSPPVPRPVPRKRDVGLRLALFCTLLGAALTMVYAQLLAHQDSLAPTDVAGLAAYHQILVPLLAVVAVAGGLVLERAAALGVLLLLLGTGWSLAGGGVWLLPGTLIACIWAVRHNHAARLLLGFLLLVPGIAAGYFGIVATLSFLSQVQVNGLPPGLDSPLALSQALAPLELLPLALLGACLLIRRHKP